MADRQHDPESVLPLKSMVFHVAVVLSEGERHGYAIVKEIERRWGDGTKILPGNLYRTIRSMLAEGLIAETETRPDPDENGERRRYFRLTSFGEQVAQAEARRLEELVRAARSADLLAAKGGE